MAGGIERSMNLYDQHLHSIHSFDSHADPNDVVRRAVELGLAGISFTDHYDTHPDERDACVYDDDRYTATIADLRERFGTSVRIGKGIEVDYQADTLTDVVSFLDARGFDIVLLSVHWSRGRPIHRASAWEDRDPSAVTREYLQSVLSAVRHCERVHRGRGPIVNVLGHLDFCKRYSQRYAGTVHVAEHMDVIDEILLACLSAGVIPEVNTSTLRNRMPEPMPGPAVIRRYAELGGTMMSLGSDAHRAGQVGADFPRALNLLRAAGIHNLAVFRNRQVHPEPIPAEPSECGTPISE